MMDTLTMDNILMMDTLLQKRITSKFPLFQDIAPLMSATSIAKDNSIFTEKASTSKSAN